MLLLGALAAADRAAVLRLGSAEKPIPADNWLF